MNEDITPTPRALWPQWLKAADTENAVVTVDDGRVIWHGGNWYDGAWRNGVWHGGNWYDGVWYDGEWRGGTRHGGYWYGGNWLGGHWLGGLWNGGNEWRVVGPPGSRPMRQDTPIEPAAAPELLAVALMVLDTATVETPQALIDAATAAVRKAAPGLLRKVEEVGSPPVKNIEKKSEE